MTEKNMLSRYMKAKAVRMRTPLVSAFEISPICNFRCRMCYVRRTPEQVRKRGGLLPAEWWLETARQARAEGLLYPLLTGGEPFLYPGIQKLLSELSRMGMLVTMNTNGSLIDEAVIEWLQETPPLRLNLTLYGASDAAYAALCGDPKGFTRVRRAVELLQQAGIPIRFNCSLVPQNTGELKQILDYGNSVGIPVKVAAYMFPPIRRLENSYGENERLTPEESGYQKVLADYYQKTPEEFAKSARFYQGFTPLEEIDFASLEPGPGEPMRCLAGKCSYWVDWRGNLSFCGMTDEAGVSLKEHSFREAWRQVVDYAEHVVCRRVCTGCPNCRICHTCVSMVYSETGDRNGRPEYYCRMMDAQAKAYRSFMEKRKTESTD